MNPFEINVSNNTHNPIKSGLTDRIVSENRSKIGSPAIDIIERMLCSTLYSPKYILIQFLYTDHQFHLHIGLF